MPLPVLADLLNPADAAGRRVQEDMRAGLVDIRPQLNELVTFASRAERAPMEIQQKIVDVLQYLQQNTHAPLPPPSQRISLNRSESPLPEKEFDVRLNSKTLLSILYRYPPNTVVEYPETASKAVGHLFHLDPDDWQMPDLNIAYSRGQPCGQTGSGKHFYVPLLVDRDGNEVPCIESHSTCTLNIVILKINLVYILYQAKASKSVLTAT